MTVTQRGDPRLIIPFQLEKIDSKDETTWGQATMSVIVFDDEDPEKRRGANMMKERLRALCEAAAVNLAESYPTEVSDSSDFDELFRALEGKRGICWTAHTKFTTQTGETNTNVDLRFSRSASQPVAIEPEHKSRRGTRNDKIRQR